LKGQELPSCDFCGRKGHTETACRIKQESMASAKKYTKGRSSQWKKYKAEKSQSFAAAAASTSKQEDNSSDEEEDDKDKQAFMKSFMASWKSGDCILLQKPGLQRNLSAPKEGPYTILEVGKNRTVKIQRGIIHERINIRRIEPFFEH
jgi:hypothetical protein